MFGIWYAVQPLSVSSLLVDNMVTTTSLNRYQPRTPSAQRNSLITQASMRKQNFRTSYMRFPSTYEKWSRMRIDGMIQRKDRDLTNSGNKHFALNEKSLNKHGSKQFLVTNWQGKCVDCIYRSVLSMSTANFRNSYSSLNTQ